MSKLNPSKAHSIRTLYGEGLPPAELARQFDVTRTTIRHVLKGQTWKDAPGKTYQVVRQDRDTEGIARKRAIKRAIYREEPYAEIERRFDVPMHKIARVARGEIWGHVEVSNA